jgi:hypothetical protein
LEAAVDLEAAAVHLAYPDHSPVTFHREEVFLSSWGKKDLQDGETDEGEARAPTA